MTNPQILQAINVFEVILRQARQEHWPIWKREIVLSLPALQRVCTNICELLRIPIPLVEHDPTVGTAMGIYQPIEQKIRLATRTTGSGVSVMTLLHELAHHACYRLNIPPTEENARAISITAFFSVWPDKKGRTDIMYQDALVAR